MITVLSEMKTYKDTNKGQLKKIKINKTNNARYIEPCPAPFCRCATCRVQCHYLCRSVTKKEKKCL